jgi:hypothetical protein
LAGGGRGVPLDDAELDRASTVELRRDLDLALYEPGDLLHANQSVYLGGEKSEPSSG